MKTIYLQRPDYSWIKFEFNSTQEIIDKCTEIGNGVIIGDEVTIGDWVKIGNGVIIGDWVKIGNEVIIGDGVKIGDEVIIGNWVIIGDWVKIGDWVIIGNGVKIGDEVKIDLYTSLFASNLYQYATSAYYDSNKVPMIQLGCYLRTRKEWESDFWNNPGEFPNDPTNEKSNARLRAFKIASTFLDLIKPK